MVLGITGGIGSGKSVVCRVFSILGAPVFSADDEARIIMETDPDIMKEVENAAGEKVYENGMLNRKKLASLIFNDRQKLASVNRVVHPAVFNSFVRWKERTTAPLVIFESAILFESGADKLTDRILNVNAPIEVRIERVMERNTLSEQEVTERINNQWSDEQRSELSDYVISNTGNELILPAILRIYRELISLSGR